MEIGEEMDDGHLGDIERGVVAAPIPVARGAQVKSGGRVQRVEDRRKLGGGGGAERQEAPFAQAPDHVEVEHGHRLDDRDHRMADVVAAAEQPQLLAAEGDQEDTARGWAGGELAGNLNQRRGPGRVVIGAIVDLPAQLGAEAADHPGAEVVVVGADDNDLIPPVGVGAPDQPEDVEAGPTAEPGTHDGGGISSHGERLEPAVCSGRLHAGRLELPGNPDGHRIGLGAAGQAPGAGVISQPIQIRRDPGRDRRCRDGGGRGLGRQVGRAQRSQESYEEQKMHGMSLVS